ncbi:MAG: hypothetical protein EZS28_038245, partial [Streblomastix strix]
MQGATENFDTFPKLRIVPSNELPKYLKASNQRLQKIKSGYDMITVLASQEKQLAKEASKGSALQKVESDLYNTSDLDDLNKPYHYIPTPKMPKKNEPLYLNLPTEKQHITNDTTNSLTKEIETLIWEGDKEQKKKNKGKDRIGSSSDSFNGDGQSTPINDRREGQLPPLSQRRGSTDTKLRNEQEGSPNINQRSSLYQKQHNQINTPEASAPLDSPNITQPQLLTTTKSGISNNPPKTSSLPLGITRLYKRFYGHPPTDDETNTAKTDPLWVMVKVSETMKKVSPNLQAHFKEGMRTISLMQYASEKSDEKYASIEKQKAAHLTEHLTQMFDLYELENLKFLTPATKRKQAEKLRIDIDKTIHEQDERERVEKEIDQLRAKMEAEREAEEQERLAKEAEIQRLKQIELENEKKKEAKLKNKKGKDKDKDGKKEGEKSDEKGDQQHGTSDGLSPPALNFSSVDAKRRQIQLSLSSPGNQDQSQSSFAAST